jgi:ATP-dependent Clp endopeptidase proteolytic subunit ClpP
VSIKGVIVSNDDLEIYDWFGIEAVSPNKVAEQIVLANDGDIEVDINSPGGDVFAGTEIYTALKDHKGHVTTRIVGVAASAASVAAMAGDTVMISPPAQIMIHNATNWSHGDHRDHQRSAEMIQNTNTSMANAYALKSGMKKDELLEMMDKETWISAQQAVEMGFADEIMFDDKDNPKLIASAGATQMIPAAVIERTRNELMKNRKPINHLQAPPQGAKGEDTVQDLKELQEKHPEIYNEAVTVGRSEERNRITALNALADAPGAAEIVAKAIGDGRTVAEAAIEIVTASKQRITNEAAARVNDSASSNAALVPAEGPAPQANAEQVAQAEADAITAEIKRLRGGK